MSEERAFIENWWKRKFSMPNLPTGDDCPMENGYMESLNGKFRDECPNENWFVDLADARQKIEEWRCDYNQERPHSALGCLTPAEFAHRSAASSGADLAVIARLVLRISH